MSSFRKQDGARCGYASRFVAFYAKIIETENIG